MPRNKSSEIPGLFKGVVMAHLVLLLHLMTVGGLGLLVFFFRGIIHYQGWIFLGGSAAVAACAYHLYRRVKKEGKSLGEILRSALPGGRRVEVSFLGGLASLKIDGTGDPSAIDVKAGNSSRQLEDPADIQIRELTTLLHMLEKNLITLDEYQRAKQQIFRK